jgi:transposase
MSRYRLTPTPTQSYRVTRDRSGRWHVSFAAIPEPIPGLGTGEIVGIDRGVVISAALSTGELLQCPGLRPAEQARFRRLERKLARARKSSQRRRGVKMAIAKLKAREGDRRKDWAEKTSTSLARRFDVIRALFRCAACGCIGDADVNAARNIAAGHAVSARGRSPLGERKNREPQPLSLSA